MLEIPPPRLVAIDPNPAPPAPDRDKLPAARAESTIGEVLGVSVLCEDCLPGMLSVAQVEPLEWHGDLCEDPDERPNTLTEPPWGDLGPILYRRDL